MAKFNLNALTQPTMELIMRDEQQTTLHLVCPSEKLVERLQEGMTELKEILDKKDKASIDACYKLAADLISENEERVTVTADELRNKYGFNSDLILVMFFKAYMDFIAELNNAKN